MIFDNIEGVKVSYGIWAHILKGDNVDLDGVGQNVTTDVQTYTLIYELCIELFNVDYFEVDLPSLYVESIL